MIRLKRSNPKQQGDRGSCQIVAGRLAVGGPAGHERDEFRLNRMSVIARSASDEALTIHLSLPGLTRQSMVLKRLFFKMDARVKPAHDEAIFIASDITRRYFTSFVPVMRSRLPTVWMISTRRMFAAGRERR